MLAVVPQTTQIVTDLRSVKAEQGQHDFTVKDQQFIHHVNAQTTRKSCYPLQSQDCSNVKDGRRKNRN